MPRRVLLTGFKPFAPRVALPEEEDGVYLAPAPSGLPADHFARIGDQMRLINSPNSTEAVVGMVQAPHGVELKTAVLPVELAAGDKIQQLIDEFGPDLVLCLGQDAYPKPWLEGEDRQVPRAVSLETITHPYFDFLSQGGKFELETDRGNLEVASRTDLDALMAAVHRCEIDPSELIIAPTAGWKKRLSYFCGLVFRRATLAMETREGAVLAAHIPFFGSADMLDKYWNVTSNYRRKAQENGFEMEDIHYMDVAHVTQIVEALIQERLRMLEAN